MVHKISESLGNLLPDLEISSEKEALLRNRNGGDFKSSDILSNGKVSQEYNVLNPDIEGYYDRLISEAPYIPGDKMDLVPVSEISWANPTLLKQGVLFGIKNLFSLLIANTAALMYGFSVKPESVVLLRSGRFHTPEKSFLRYLSTGHRIGSWYRYDLTDPNSEAIKNIKAVRKLHTFYAKAKNPFPSLEDMGYTPEMSELINAIHKDLAHLDLSDAPQHLLTWDPPLQFSQFDVAMTQFGFIGLIYLYPETVGLGDPRLMDGFLHLWAIIGRLLGLEDRFNLALHADKELFKKLYMNIGMASLQNTDETVICLQHSLMEGLSKRVPVLTLKSWIYYGLQSVDGFKGEEIQKLMSWKDKVGFCVLKWTIKAVREFFIIRLAVNIWTIVLLQIANYIHLPKGCPM